MKQSLDGHGWKAQYFRPKRPLRKGEFEINNLLLNDGEAAGAATLEYDDRAWLDARIPSDVRDILIRGRVIPDPYLGRNSDASAWVTQYEWWFRKRFAVKHAWRGRRIRLVFKGVDLQADYYLNGVRLGSSNDMFVPQVFEITGLVRAGQDNVLAVRLQPQPMCVANHFRAGDIPERARYHKAQVSWGWDWSREMISMGIWDGVFLEAADTVFITDWFVEGRPQGGKKSALRVQALADSAANLAVELQIDVTECRTGRSVFRQQWSASFKRGPNKWAAVLPLQGVEYWYPNGYGHQPLYRARLEFRLAGRRLASRTVVFGIRAVRMLRNPKAPRGAYPLVFSVNGRRIFAMGANWVPPDLLFGRLNFRRYESLVKRAADVGFNMLRVWGGGLVEKDAFYDCCDRHGILVWQEFPLACANYPKDKNFVREKEVEADRVIRKLRNHPCLALYCGGNELFYYGESSRSPVLRRFKKKVAELHPMIDYHYSSPDKERPGERDHGPWSYQPQHHTYWNRHVRNFASELGCNACLDYKNLRKFLTAGEMELRGPALNHHFVSLEKDPRNGVHCYGGVKLFNCVSDRDIVFASQFVQADTCAYVMARYRARAWRSSGVLFWQYNSAWPEGMWSLVDYYGTPKLAFYFLKEVCRRQSIHIEDQDWELKGRRELRVRIHFLGDDFVQGAERDIGWSLLDEGGRRVDGGCRKLRNGGELSLDLRKYAGFFEKGYFRLQVALGGGETQAVTRSQFYALGTWKEVPVRDLGLTVTRFARAIV